MKKVYGEKLKFLAVGTVLILIFKAVNDFDDVKAFSETVRNVFLPCTLGIFIAFFLYLPSKMLEELVAKSGISVLEKKSRVIGTLTVYIIIFAAVSFSLVYILPVLYKNAVQVFESVPGYINKIDGFFSSNKYLSRIDTSKLLSTELVGTLSRIRVNEYVKVARDVLDSFISLFVSFVISAYIIIDRESIIRYLHKIKHRIAGERFSAAEIYAGRIVKLFYSYFAGLAFDSLILGIICAAGLWLLRIPYALLLGFITAVGNLVPFFGPIVAAVIVVFISFITGGMWQILPVSVFLVLIYAVDGYFIQPGILGKSTGLKPLLVLISVVVFGKLFGVMGMFLGVPVIAAVKLILDDYLKDGSVDGRI